MSLVDGEQCEHVTNTSMSDDQKNNFLSGIWAIKQESNNDI